MSSRQHKENLFEGMKAPIDQDKIWAKLVEHPEFPHEKKKNRGFIWFFSGLAAIALTAALYLFNTTNSTNQISKENTTQQSEVAQTTTSAEYQTEKTNAEIINSAATKPTAEEAPEAIDIASKMTKSTQRKTASVKAAQPLHVDSQDKVENSNDQNADKSISPILPLLLEETSQHQTSSQPMDRPTAYEGMQREADSIATHFAKTTVVATKRDHALVTPLSTLYLVPLQRVEDDAAYVPASAPVIALREDKSQVIGPRFIAFAGSFYSQDRHNLSVSADEMDISIDSDDSYSYGAELGGQYRLPKKLFVEAGLAYRKSSISLVSRQSTVHYELAAANNAGILFNSVRRVNEENATSSSTSFEPRLLIGKYFSMKNLQPFVAAGVGYHWTKVDNSNHAIDLEGKQSSHYYIARGGLNLMLTPAFNISTYIETNLSRKYASTTDTYTVYPVQLGVRFGYSF